MAKAYAHKKPKDRILSYGRQRRYEIAEQIDRLRSEDEMLADIEKLLKPLVCDVCLGEGNIMIPIPGCEMDGPRQHTCPKCKGTGEPS